MGRKIKTAIRNLIFNSLVKFIPELILLKDRELSWSYLRSTLSESIIDEFTKIQPPYKITKTKIGKGTYLAPNSNVSLAEIGKYCSIGPNFFCGWGIHPIDGLSTSPMFYSTLMQNGRTLSVSDKIQERKVTLIGNDVFIGANVTVLDGVVIGDGAIIGAGAVVSKDIPPYAIAVGCPIKIVKYRFSQEHIDKLLSIKWWNFEENELQDVEKHFFDIDNFIKKHFGK